MSCGEGEQATTRVIQTYRCMAPEHCSCNQAREAAGSELRRRRTEAPEQQRHSAFPMSSGRKSRNGPGKCREELDEVQDVRQYYLASCSEYEKIQMHLVINLCFVAIFLFAYASDLFPPKEGDRRSIGVYHQSLRFIVVPIATLYCLSHLTHNSHIFTSKLTLAYTKSITHTGSLTKHTHRTHRQSFSQILQTNDTTNKTRQEIITYVILCMPDKRRRAHRNAHTSTTNAQKQNTT